MRYWMLLAAGFAALVGQPAWAAPEPTPARAETQAAPGQNAAAARSAKGKRRPVAAAAVPPPPPSDPGSQCRAAIAASEQQHGIAPGLLGAIGRVESGRRDPNGGGVTPWPWTINAEGQGRYFQTKFEAIAAVLELQARGVTVIDVGCMQVNLHHHPTAFATLDQAFDPVANARYAGLFLKRLAAAANGDWEKAAGHYHSYTPERAEGYRALVLAAWSGQPVGPATALVAGTVDPVMLQRVIRVNGRNIRALALNGRPDLTGERLSALRSVGVPLRLTGQQVRGRPVFMVELADGTVRPSNAVRR